MNIKKHIPNMLTVGNLLSGSLAIVFTLHSGRPEVAMWLIVLAAVFDFFDGMVARLLGVSSPIGKDLDSLADVVSFGLAPAVLAFHALDGLEAGNYLAYGVFIIPAFAALRLAKVNNDIPWSTRPFECTLLARCYVGYSFAWGACGYFCYAGGLPAARPCPVAPDGRGAPDVLLQAIESATK